ncbi:MAG: MgtC/SapB family protein [Anaeroplasma sp.]
MFNIKIYDPIVKLLNWNWLIDITFGSIIIRILLATICGGILGVERAKKHHAAGLRTYILVCVGSCIAMMTNQYVSSIFDTDVARLGAQVISGIGFLGAGTILVTSRNQIKGLTTAAGLWACACLGLSIGIGFYTLSLFSCLLIILVIAFLPGVEEKITKRSLYFDIHIEFGCRENMKEFIKYARNNGLKVISIERNSAYSASGLSVYTICLLILNKSKRNHSIYLDSFRQLSYVNYVEEIK